MSSQHQIPAKNPSSDWQIEELPGLSTEEQLQLQNCGMSTTKQLLQATRTPEARIKLANQLQVDIHHVNKWVALSDLARIPSVGTEYCGSLLHAGIVSVAQLAATPIYRLHKQVLRLQVATTQSRALCPGVEVIQQWVQQAKLLLPN
jgi:predicted flap endonuclease-1-like 5' DNA nuclease